MDPCSQAFPAGCGAKTNSDAVQVVVPLAGAAALIDPPMTLAGSMRRLARDLVDFLDQAIRYNGEVMHWILMMKPLRALLLIAAVLGLSACAGRPSLEDPALSDRDLNLEEFFAGELIAHGQFQDILGNVSRRFTVEVNGTWNGETLRLVEDFVYEDKSTERRVWTLRKVGQGTWKGTAPGVIGVANGRERGDMFNWQYTIDLPTGDGETTRVSFDDWMWLLTDDRLLNRAYMERFGVPVGEVIIIFERS